MSSTHYLEYQEFDVHPDLQKFIICYWQFRVQNIDSSEGSLFHYILPDGCPSLIFSHIPKFHLFGVSLFGPTKLITEREVFAYSTFFGIRFKPGFSSELLGFTGEQLRDKTISSPSKILCLDVQNPQVYWHNNVFAFRILETKLNHKSNKNPPHDPLIISPFSFCGFCGLNIRI